MNGIPDMVGEIVAYRAWPIVEPKSRHPRLRSATASDIWPTNRWFEAECAGGHCTEDNLPQMGCSCGLYAAKTLEQLLGMGYGQMRQDGAIAIGEVAFSGKIVECSQGWRAQRGRIKKLYFPLSQCQLGERLAEIYNVPWEPATWWALDPRVSAAAVRRVVSNQQGGN
jgi:hypothetical protein